jgi:hypothetical protein
MQALLELDCMPSGMELFPAADDDQWTLIQKVIDDCDYYIVVIGGRYGSVERSSGKSYTQLEYEYAVRKGRPVIAFVHAHPKTIESGKSEPTEQGRRKLEKFKELVLRKMCKTWSSPADLGSVVSRSLIKLIKDRPGVGWVRGNMVPDESSAQEVLRLTKRVQELETAVERARTEPPVGSAQLAQGDEKIPIEFSWRLTLAGEFHSGSMEFKFAWSELIALLTPLMVDRASEPSLKSALVANVRDSISEKLMSEYEGTDPRHIYPTVLDSDFQKVKVQLMALGLIRKEDSPRSVKDTATYWTLTPYGEAQMTRLVAIQSKARRQDLPKKRKYVRAAADA